MKNVRTFSLSMPGELVDKIDKMANMMNISRSALLTGMLSVLLNMLDEGDVKAWLIKAGREKKPY